MSKLVGVVAGLIAIALPILAQDVTSLYRAPSNPPDARIHTISWQDRDDDRQRSNRDRDHNWGRNDNDRNGQYHRVLPSGQQQNFDSYYQRWLQYRATNNRGEAASMERRMHGIMSRNNIPANVPFDQIASPGVGGNAGYNDRVYRNGDGHGRQGGYGQREQRLSADDQSRFDNYYSRWLNYRRTNNQSEIASMESRMRELMSRNNIPANVPFEQVASPNVR